MWLKILRQNLSHLARRAKGSASFEQKNGNGNNKASKTNNNGAEVNRNEEQNGSLDKSQAKKKPVVPGGTPLLQQTTEDPKRRGHQTATGEISTSQMDFFRMLDEKIESGPDYDESSDATLRAEHIKKLLRSWELASISWSNVELNSNASIKSQYQQQTAQAQHQQLQPAPKRGLVGLQQQQQPSPQQQQQQQVHRSISHKSQLAPVSAKDREGMRNIVGGRPESAPVYVQRLSSANRLDGLQDVGQHHCASPSMPRHVLESISQSPTQSLKTPPGVASPTAASRYAHYYHHPDLQQQQQPVKVTKVQYSQGPSPLNGEYAYRGEREYARREQQQQQYDSPVLLRNSPSNPYLHKFQISPSPQGSPVGQLPPAQPQQPQQQQQQYAGQRRRAGAYGAAQMT